MSDPVFSCPLCDGVMTIIPEAPKSVWVRCNNPCDPQCHENVEGHGENPKEAHSVACQKYKKL